MLAPALALAHCTTLKTSKKKAKKISTQMPPPSVDKLKNNANHQKIN
jgi:hypothetical protein